MGVHGGIHSRWGYVSAFRGVNASTQGAGEVLTNVTTLGSGTNRANQDWVEVLP